MHLERIFGNKMIPVVHNVKSYLDVASMTLVYSRVYSHVKKKKHPFTVLRTHPCLITIFLHIANSSNLHTSWNPQPILALHCLAEHQASTSAFSAVRLTLHTTQPTTCQIPNGSFLDHHRMYRPRSGCREYRHRRRKFHQRLP